MQYTIQIVLKNSLRRWELAELSKPTQDQRKVPNLSEIAEATGYTRATISNLANDNRVNIDLAIVGKVITYLVSLGIEVTITDIFQIVPVTAPTETTA